MKFEWKEVETCAVEACGVDIANVDPRSHEMWCGDHQFGFYIVRVEGDWVVLHLHSDWPEGQFLTHGADSLADGKRIAEESAVKHLN